VYQLGLKTILSCNRTNYRKWIQL